MTAARYGAMEGALASGSATAQLHHSRGHDPWSREKLGAAGRAGDDRGPKRAAILAVADRGHRSCTTDAEARAVNVDRETLDRSR